MIKCPPRTGLGYIDIEYKVILTFTFRHLSLKIGFLGCFKALGQDLWNQRVCMIMWFNMAIAST